MARIVSGGPKTLRSFELPTNGVGGQRLRYAAALDRESLRAHVDRLRWHHQIDFGNGVLSNGNAKLDVLNAQASVYFRDGVAGKSRAGSDRTFEWNLAGGK
jgi:hypothetical protein